MSNLARCSVIAEVDRSRGLGSPLVQMSYIDILYSHASCNALLVHIISADITTHYYCTFFCASAESCWNLSNHVCPQCNETCVPFPRS